MLYEIPKDKYQKIAKKLALKLGEKFSVEAINSLVPHRCFTFLNGEKEVLACAVLYFPKVKYLGEKCCFFGNFICCENEKIFTQFFAALEKETATAKHLIGPINGSTWTNYRWALTEGAALFAGDVENPVFYPKFLQKIGYKVISHYQTSRDTQLLSDKKTLARKAKHLSAFEWRIRPLNPQKIEEDLAQIYDLCQIAFAHNFLFSPLSQSDFILKYQAILSLIPTEMILVAEDEAGKIIAFILAYPDGKGGAVIKTLARRPKDKYRGIGLLLCQKMYDNLRLKNYKYALHALMQQTNYSVKTSTTLSGEVVRTYGLFGKPLNGRHLNS